MEVGLAGKKKQIRVLSKDEMRILGVALHMVKYDLAENAYTKEDARKIVNKLGELSDRLFEEGKDNRRRGRTSIDDVPDVVKRYCL